ncbi:unnamed protein product [Calypogeia fissa]
MGLLDKLWDDVVAGPQPTKGLGKLRQKQGAPQEGDAESVQSIMDRRRSGEFTQLENEARRVTQSISIKKPPPIRTNFDSTAESPVASPVASSPSASPAAREKDNIWRSVFHPGQNRAMKTVGSAKFDNVSPNSSSPTVYDWVVISALDRLYSGKHKSEYR